MNKYSTYKDSGVEWIGKVPENWSVKRLKWESAISTGTTPPSDNSEYFEGGNFDWYTPSDFTNDLILSSSKRKITILAVEDGKVKVYPKNTVYMVGIGATLGKVGVSTIESSSNQQINSISFHNSTTALFTAYFLKVSSDIIKMMSNSATLPILNQSQTKEIEIPIPPLPEQQAIVTYLNEKTTLIDDLIKKKQEKIQLLKENRMALINHVVTKGLDPEVEMKDSGVEWIGEVPEHWSLSKVKHQFSFEGGGTPSKEKDEYWDGTIPWVSPKDMKSPEIDSSEDKITELGLVNSSSKLIKPYSLLIVVRSGILQRTIPIGINQIPVSINQDLKALTPKSSISIRYFYHFIKGNEKNLLIEWLKQGTTVESIEMEFMANSALPCPPISEQQQIVTYLDEQTQLIDQTIQQEEQKIELLKEYRQSLISEVVTGKICVLGN